MRIVQIVSLSRANLGMNPGHSPEASLRPIGMWRDGPVWRVAWRSFNVYLRLP
jgi:hypothetical protein